MFAQTKPNRRRIRSSDRYEGVQLCADELRDLRRHGNAGIVDGRGHRVDAADMAGQDLAGDRRPGGRTTLVGNGRTRDVIGQTMAKPVFSVNAAEETTRAGRRPACSLPLVGSKSVQIKSPWPGTYAGTVTP